MIRSLPQSGQTLLQCGGWTQTPETIHTSTSLPCGSVRCRTMYAVSQMCQQVRHSKDQSFASMFTDYPRWGIC